MTTITDQLRSAVAAHEASLADIDRPDLSGRTRRRRTVRRLGQGAAGVGSLAAVTAAGLTLAGVDLGTLAPWAGNPAGLHPAGEGVSQEATFQGALVLNAQAGVLVEDPATAVVVDIYLDPMCPYCSMFATTVEPELLATEGVTVVLHPVAYLDRYSDDGSYSTRAGNAIQEVATGAPERLQAFLEQVWTRQPAEGSGLTDAELQDLARRAAVPEAIVERFPEQRFAAAIAQASTSAAEAGITYVPYIMVDGEPFTPDRDATTTDPRDGSWTGLFETIETAQDAR